jgi:hypothetical protein
MARILTFVFDVPIVAMFSYLMFYLFKVHDLSSFLISILFMSVIPLLAWTHLLKHPKDFKGERKLSFVIDILSYSIGFVILLIMKKRNIYSALALSYLLNAAALAIINKAGYKASGHGAGIGGPATALTFAFGWSGAISFLFLLPVGYAKVKLKDHTPLQFIIGAGLSAAITYISFVIMGAV